MAFTDQFVAACVKVMRAGLDGHEISLESFTEGTPEGFLPEVLGMLVKDHECLPGVQEQLTPTMIEALWNRNRSELLGLIEAALQDPLLNDRQPGQPVFPSGCTETGRLDADPTTTTRVWRSHIPHSEGDLSGRDSMSDTVELDKTFVFEDGGGRADLDNCGDEPSDRISMDKVLVLMTELEARLTQFVDEKIVAALETRTGGPDPDMPASPPPRPKTGPSGKRLAGSKCDVRVRVDKVLWDLFQQEVIRHNGNASAAMDTILWNYFGRPPLSFQDEQNT